MALYRLSSYPDPPPSIVRTGKRAPWLFAGLLPVGILLAWLLGHWAAACDPSYVRIAKGLMSCVAMLVGVGLVITGAQWFFGKRVYDVYGRQTWEITPAGITYRYPGRPDQFVPADALMSFAVSQKGGTILRAAAPYKGLWLSPHIADREALRAEFRALRIPEARSTSSWRLLNPLKSWPAWLCLLAGSFSGTRYGVYVGLALVWAFAAWMSWKERLRKQKLDQSTTGAGTQIVVNVGLSALYLLLALKVLLHPTHRHH